MTRFFHRSVVGIEVLRISKYSLFIHPLLLCHDNLDVFPRHGVREFRVSPLLDSTTVPSERSHILDVPLGFLCSGPLLFPSPLLTKYVTLYHSFPNLFYRVP